jgi:SAM-dependent methyltransferase
VAVQYASSFVSGFQDVIRANLPTILPDARIQRCDNGLILYASAATPAKVAGIRFFNNTFAALSSAETGGDDPLRALAAHVRQDDGWLDALRLLFPKARTYVLRAAVANDMTALHPVARQKLEHMLEDAGYKQGGTRPDVDIWLQVRREGYGFLGVRCASPQQEAPLAKGELRPELAHLLCLLSEPSPTDRFLDPFCGSGAIAIERLRAFPASEVWAGDKDWHLVKSLRERAGKRLKVEEMDAADLKQFADGSIDVIVTDPPWGQFADAVDLAAILKEFAHVVSPGGRIVLLLARNLPLELDGLPLSRAGSWDILVSGKKATAHVLRRDIGDM